MSKIDSERLLESWKDTIAQRLKQILKAKGWAQKDLAEKIGKDAAYTSKLLSGEINLTFRTLAELQISLGYSIVAGLPILPGALPHLTDAPTFEDLKTSLGLDPTLMNKEFYEVGENADLGVSINRYYYACAI